MANNNNNNNIYDDQSEFCKNKNEYKHWMRLMHE